MSNAKLSASLHVDTSFVRNYLAKTGGQLDYERLLKADFGPVIRAVMGRFATLFNYDVTPDANAFAYVARNTDAPASGPLENFVYVLHSMHWKTIGYRVSSRFDKQPSSAPLMAIMSERLRLEPNGPQSFIYITHDRGIFRYLEHVTQNGVYKSGLIVGPDEWADDAIPKACGTFCPVSQFFSFMPYLVTPRGGGVVEEVMDEFSVGGDRDPIGQNDEG